MDKTAKKNLKKEEETEEEVEEVEEEVEEEEDQIGEDFAKDPRAYALWVDAGKIADLALKHVISLAKDQANIYQLCVSGDNYIREELNKVYTKKKYTKGIAFPTSVSVNEICGHYSPTADDVSTNTNENVNTNNSNNSNDQVSSLKTGDLVKIDLGVHIHGFAAVVAHTIVVGEEKTTGKKADVILAAYKALQAALRTLKVDRTNDEVTKNTKSVCDAYSVNPVEGVLSHRMRRDIIDGFETIINKSSNEHKVDSRKFEHGDVFGVDVLVSSGEGKPKESTSIRTTIYKRALETTYKLKIDSSRKLLSVVEHNFFNFPFSLNAFDNEENIKTVKPIENLKTVSKTGLAECIKHELFYPHPVLIEKKGEYVAQFKWTVAVRKEGPIVLCGEMIDESKFESSGKIEDKDLNTLLEESSDPFLPNSKKSVKNTFKKDNKAKKAKKKAAKEAKEEA